MKDFLPMTKTAKQKAPTKKHKSAAGDSVAPSIDDLPEDDDGTNVGGRPRIAINLDQLRALARLQATYEEAASFFNCTERTIKRRMKEPEFAQAWAIGQAEGRMSLRRLMWRHAQQSGSSGTQMSIHLSKHWLGMTERAALELTGKNGGPVELKTSARERVNAKLDTLGKRIQSRVAGIAAAAGATTVSRESV